MDGHNKEMKDRNILLQLAALALNTLRISFLFYFKHFWRLKGPTALECPGYINLKIAENLWSMQEVVYRASLALKSREERVWNTGSAQWY